MPNWLPPLVAEQGLEIHPGNQVLEIRIPGPSKATALEQLLTPDTSAALFAGDDYGDLPAVSAVSAWAAATGHPSLTVAVGELAELRRTADTAVASPVELAELLTRLAWPLPAELSARQPGHRLARNPAADTGPAGNDRMAMTAPGQPPDSPLVNPLASPLAQPTPAARGDGGSWWTT